VLRAEGFEPVILELALGAAISSPVSRVMALSRAFTLWPYRRVPVEAEHWTHAPFSGDLASASTIAGGGLCSIREQFVITRATTKAHRARLTIV